MGAENLEGVVVTMESVKQLKHVFPKQQNLVVTS